MAPLNFPNGITLHSLGFAALKYPAFPAPPINVPLSNQIGALQLQPPSLQNHQVAQIASQYLSSLLIYQTSSAEEQPTLHDPNDTQYYVSTALYVLNYLNMNPDACKRIAMHKKSAIVNAVVEKLLEDGFVARMQNVKRPAGPMGIPPTTFDDDFGSLLQFLSTELLYKKEIEEEGNLHPRIQDLIPKLKVWKKEFRYSRTKTISRAAERLVGQISGDMEEEMIAGIRMMQEQSVVCGERNCGVRGKRDLEACAKCRIQRYCGREHQRADWKWHKQVCEKGLVEEDEGEGEESTT